MTTALPTELPGDLPVDTVLAAFGVTGEQATVVVDALGTGDSLPAVAPGVLLAVVEDDGSLLDPADLPPLAGCAARARIVTAGDLAATVDAAGWTVVGVRTTGARLVALAFGSAGRSEGPAGGWPALVAHLEAERAAAIARAELVDGILVTLGGQYAVEQAARAEAAEALAAVAVADLVAERDLRLHVSSTVNSQAAEIARLVAETYELKQRLVGPDGAVSPRVASALTQVRRVRRALRRRLAARR